MGRFGAFWGHFWGVLGGGVFWRFLNLLYPDCVPCDCGNGICDPHSGDCICPPNTNSDCTDCGNNYFQFHPILGCVDCTCNHDGSDSLSCDVETGQCACADFVTGRECDRCEDGYWGFPNCQACECNEAGSTLTSCDSDGSCLCKNNVQGRQCSYCQDSTFNLNNEDPSGCTECFCFGAFGAGEKPVCQSARYQVDAFYDDQSWKLLKIQNEENVGEIDSSGTLWVYDILSKSENIPYWESPVSYLGNKVSAYGGTLSWNTKCSAQRTETVTETTDNMGECRGDNCGKEEGSEDYDNYESTNCVCDDDVKYLPDLVLTGAHMPLDIVYNAELMKHKNMSNNNGEFSVELLERNFKWSDGRALGREDFMMVLVKLSGIKIKATCSKNFESLGITSPVLSYVDFSASSNFAGLPTVEVCQCPAGYIGSSCEDCDKGYYRESSGRYLGQCLPCKCNGNCETCGSDGLPSTMECKKHTTGTFCEECEFGFIKEKNSDSCEKCPCPLPMGDNSFASQCWSVAKHAKNNVGTENAGENGGNSDLTGGSSNTGSSNTGSSNTGSSNSGSFNSGSPNTGAFNGGNGNLGNYTGSLESLVGRNDGGILDQIGAFTDESVYCECNNGYLGDQCETCDVGFFGDPMMHGSSCQKCDCNGNSLTCDISNGVCDDCGGNTGGDHCENCAEWYFGNAAKFCEVCLCDRCGTNSCDTGWFF